MPIPTFKFNPDKAVEVILYLAKRLKTPDFYNVLKLLYFADLMHIENYGRFICGDNYIAMKEGPVPSKTYDILKYVRGDGSSSAINAKEAFNVINHYQLQPNRDANIDIFSDSEIECLDRTIKENGSLSFGELKRKSHDANWDSADRDECISLETIIKNSKNGKDLMDHIMNPYPG